MRLSKRIAAVALAAVMAVSMLTACGRWRRRQQWWLQLFWQQQWQLFQQLFGQQLQLWQQLRFVQQLQL